MRYPKALYVTRAGENIIYTLSISGYHESRSAEAFVNLNMNVPNEIVSDGLAAEIDPYNFAYDTDRKVQYLDCGIGRGAEYEITDPIPLYEFYDMIGYERKTKKFNGVSLRKTILAKMATIKAERKVQES